MKAKYYIYRNLHTKTFSVRYKGKVIDHPTNFIAYNVKFKVNEVGRLRVLRENRKNVHAFVVCDGYDSVGRVDAYESCKIHYDPYTTNSFIFAVVKIEEYPTVVGFDGRGIYLKSEV